MAAILLPTAGSAQPPARPAPGAPGAPASQPAPRPDSAAHAGHGAHAAPPATGARSAFGGWQARTGKGPDQGTVHAERGGVRVTLTAAAPGGGRVIAGREGLVSVALADVASGRPLADLELAAWIDRREGPTGSTADACKTKVDHFVQSGITMEGALRTKPIEDLNSYLVVTLNRTPDLAVLDPFLGFGRTKLFTTVPLKSPGGDWALSRDGRHLFVSQPAARSVAVVDAHTWRVVADVRVPGTPERLALSPDGAQLWVLPARAEAPAAGARPAATAAAARDTLTVLDAGTLGVVTRIPVGKDVQEVAFSPDAAFVTSGEAGTLTIVDTRRLATRAVVAVGARPGSIAYSEAARLVYVVAEGEGALVTVDPKAGKTTGRFPLGPGLRVVRAAPAPGAGHGHGHGMPRPATVSAPDSAHGAHGQEAHGPEAHAQSAAPGGQWLFVTDSVRRVVHVVDGPRREVIRTIQYEHTPDQVAFTSAFAYVRFGDNPKISMISLEDPTTGGLGSLDVFDAGQKAPSYSARGPGSAITPAPDMADAIYALNAAERMVYYYHYMEGMPIPSGGMTTYQFEPRAVLAIGKALRQREPGRYAAPVRVDEPGAYELVLLVPTPRLIQCLPFEVAADPSRRPPPPRTVLRPLTERALRVGGDTLRFALTDATTAAGGSVTATDVTITFASPAGWHERVLARRTADGTYEAAVALPEEGPYFLTVAIPSLGVVNGQTAAVVVRAGPSQPR